MNRDELLKRCVDRRVAHETSVVAVSHLFYVYLLSALKKGQQVEVPNFGTFGTRIVGARRQRRMPFFEVEEELAAKVNERYRDLKTVLLARYEVIPVAPDTEYTGKEPEYDRLVERVREEIILDTGREITIEEYWRQKVERPPVEEKPPEPIVPEAVVPGPPVEVRAPEIAAPPKERKLMPKEGFDLREEGMKEPTQPVGEPREPQPTFREISAREGLPAWLQILLGFIIIAGITFALNQFGVVQLWERKPPTVTEPLPAPVEPTPRPEVEQKVEQPTPTPTPTPAPTEVPPVTPTPQPKVEVPPAPLPSVGRYTVQVSAWTSTDDAERAVQRLRQAGFDVYIVDAYVKGRTWYRVRVGRYATQAEAQEAAARLRAVQENGVWVTKVE